MINDPWGLFLAPRSQAPMTGFILTFGTHGANLPTTQEGITRARWRAWWLPLRQDQGAGILVPTGPHYRAGKELVDLIEELTEDHIRA